MIDLIVDAILPGDAELGMPPASALDFDGYLHRHGTAHIATEFGELIMRVARDKFGAPFEALDGASRLATVNACKTANIRLFSAFLTHLLRAYYTDRAVLGRIAAGAVPPFPAGNELGADDWTLLEPVYERGPIYRRIDDTHGSN